jgi:hypothetical protein
MTITRTLALLTISPDAFDEIAGKLRSASYGHCFRDADHIDMQGILIVRRSEMPDPGAMCPVEGCDNPAGTACLRVAICPETYLESLVEPGRASDPVDV